MWLTIVGKTGDSLSGSAIVPPLLTDVDDAGHRLLDDGLPAVLPVISSACSSGTPAETSAESVRDQRASATFWTMSPIFIGTRRRKRSHCGRPHSERFHLRKPDDVPTVTADQQVHQ